MSYFNLKSVKTIRFRGGNILWGARLRSGLTRLELSRKLEHVSELDLFDLEMGHRSPKIRELNQLLKFHKLYMKYDEKLFFLSANFLAHGIN